MVDQPIVSKVTVEKAATEYQLYAFPKFRSVDRGCFLQSLQEQSRVNPKGAL